MVQFSIHERKRRVGLYSFDFNHLYKKVISKSITHILLLKRIAYGRLEVSVKIVNEFHYWDTYLSNIMIIDIKIS